MNDRVCEIEKGMKKKKELFQRDSYNGRLKFGRTTSWDGETGKKIRINDVWANKRWKVAPFGLLLLLFFEDCIWIKNWRGKKETKCTVPF